VEDYIVAVYRYADGSSRVAQGSSIFIRHNGTRNRNTMCRAVSVKLFGYTSSISLDAYLRKFLEYMLCPSSSESVTTTEAYPDLSLS
jgi:hypothetical protein